MKPLTLEETRLKEEIYQSIEHIAKCEMYDVIEVKYLKSKFEELQQENKQLQERIEYLERSNNRREDTILEQRQEISDLEDNWNKLKEYISSDWYCFDNESVEFEVAKSILDKMQELEGSDE